MLLAYAPTARSLDTRRSGAAPTRRFSLVRWRRCLPRSGRPAQIPRASLGCRAGLSKAERPGFVDDEIAVAARRIVKSACRSWLRGRCGKFFLNRRSALTKYRTNDGIRNRKMAEVLLFYKQIEFLQENQPDTPLVACISHDEKPGAKTAPDLPPVPGHYPRLRVQTPWNGYGGPGDRTSARWSTGTEVGSSSPFSVNWTPATLPQPNFGWAGAHGNAGLRPTGSSSCSRRSTG